MERRGPEAEQEGRDDGSWEDEAVGNYWGRPARPRARRALHFFVSKWRAAVADLRARGGAWERPGSG